ncbi:protein rolling stone-like isoform X1 [Lucilia sericata]|uniref:protein rolling stone-like isoform X1 n=1 Tax=Lucilia sericata TaxID=13632 RepID=UPI0018A84822|nr:protein rolling stone-like isoform X1 [Lucilia sericata]XP_037825902.1 protein rolling stone-like isoform X1 [Lucilia sericata]
MNFGLEVLARRVWYQLTGNRLRVNCGILWGTAWALIKMSNDEQSCWHRTFHPIAKEFQKDKFCFCHEPVDDFLKSQWQTSQKSFLWLLYRWGLAVCFCIGVFGSLVQQWAQGRWFIYLTDWGFFLCMFVSVFGAVIATIFYFKPDKFVANSGVIKFYWLSHWSTLVVATVITFMYWLFIYPTDDARASDLYNLWAHGFNSVLMLLDHMLVAFPTRILHFIYPLILGLAYGIFSIIYYFAGGVDINGNRYIYEILDWSQPGWATLVIFGCLILVLIFCFLLFCLYKLRKTIYCKCNNSKMTITA